MIKEIIIPKENKYILNIPDEYLNKEIEILIIPKEDKESIFKKSAGVLKDKVDPLKWQEEIRKEWDR